MKIITRQFHAVLDYITGAALIAAPWLLNFRWSEMGSMTAIGAGILILMMSLLTRYEGGAIRTVPMAMHLNMDVLLGILLAASPWILGYKDEVYLPHLIVGLFAVFSGLMTERASLGLKHS